MLQAASSTASAAWSSAASPTTRSAAVSASAAYGPVATAIALDLIRLRAGDVARRVADHHRHRPRVGRAEAAGSPPGDRRQCGAILGVGAERALTGWEVAANSRLSQLQPRHCFVVARQQPVATRSAFSDVMPKRSSARLASSSHFWNALRVAAPNAAD